MLSAVRQDHAAVAAGYTRTILGLYDQIAAAERVIESEACEQVMSDGTLQAWVSSRDAAAARLEELKTGCRSYFHEPVLLRTATLPPACE